MYIIPLDNEKYLRYIERIKKSSRVLGNMYTEKHHIVPKCLGGSDSADNLVELLPQEHYYAHKLLALENPDIKGLQYAWWLISSIKDDRSEYIRLSAEEFEEARLNYIKLISGSNNVNYGGLKPGVADKMRQTKLGQHRRWFNNGTDEMLIEAGSQPPQGYVAGRLSMAPEQRSKISAGCKGRIPGNKGTERSVESNKKASDTRKKLAAARHADNKAAAHNAKSILNITTGEKYYSFKNASDITGISVYFIKKSILTGESVDGILFSYDN